MRSSPQPTASAFGASSTLRFPRVPVDAGYHWVVSYAEDGDVVSTVVEFGFHVAMDECLAYILCTEYIIGACPVLGC